MKIALAGTGNVATVLGRLFKGAGHEIVSVWGRNGEDVRILATEMESKTGEPVEEAHLVIVAVSDDAIGKIFPGKKFNVPIVHTAGAVPSSVLQDYGQEYGVLYPLQSLRKEMRAIPEIPFLITGSDEHVTRLLEELCSTVSSNVSRSNDEERLRLHLAAVLVSNFTNHLYHQAEKFCGASNVDFKMLQPLIEETAMRIRNNSPAKMQTGPAVRKDLNTIKKHLDLIKDEPAVYEIYEFMSRSIQDQR